MPTYPIELDLNGRTVGVVGLGAVGRRKAEGIGKPDARRQTEALVADSYWLDDFATEGPEATRRPSARPSGWVPTDIPGIFRSFPRLPGIGVALPTQRTTKPLPIGLPRD
jgi:hypothetical protein